MGDTFGMFRLIALALVWFIGSYISLVYLLAIFSLVVATFIGDRVFGSDGMQSLPPSVKCFSVSCIVSE